MGLFVAMWATLSGLPPNANADEVRGLAFIRAQRFASGSVLFHPANALHLNPTHSFAFGIHCLVMG